MLANAPEQEIHRHGGQIAAPSAEEGGIPQLVNALRHPGVDAAAGNGQTLAAVAVDKVQRMDLPVPEVFRVRKLGGVRTEVFQKIVAGPDGDAGHSRIVKACRTVDHLVQSAVPAAGVEPDLLPGGHQPSGDLLRTAGPLGQQTLAGQAMLPQTVRHFINAARLVLFPGMGVNNEDMLHG